MCASWPVHALPFAAADLVYEETFDGGIMTDVTAGGPGLVAVGNPGGYLPTRDALSPFVWLDAAAVWTSVDGITWSRVPDNPVRSRNVSSVITASSGLMAVGADGPNAAVWTSADGIAWSQVTHDEATGEAG